MFAIPPGFVPCNTDNREDRFGLDEDSIHFLEGSVGGFGVEEVDARNDECVDDREDNVGLVLDGVKGNRCLVGG